MRFIVFVKANRDSEAGVMPTTEQLAEMGKFNEQLIEAGVMLAGEGLQPTSKGTRITWDRGAYSVTDGPFPQSKDLVAGFWIIQAKSKEEAVEWIARAPFVDGEVEIRQIFEAEDFGEALTPELREQEQRRRMQTASPARG